MSNAHHSQAPTPLPIEVHYADVTGRCRAGGVARRAVGHVTQLGVRVEPRARTVERQRLRAELTPLSAVGSKLHVKTAEQGSEDDHADHDAHQEYEETFEHLPRSRRWVILPIVNHWRYLRLPISALNFGFPLSSFQFPVVRVGFYLVGATLPERLDNLAQIADLIAYCEIIPRPKHIHGD